MGALTCIAFNGTPEQVEVIVDAGAVPILIKLLKLNLLACCDEEAVHAALYLKI